MDTDRSSRDCFISRGKKIMSAFDNKSSCDPASRSKILIFVIFACAALFASAREADAQWFLFGRPQRRYERCVELYEQKQFEEARACIGDFIESYPNSRWVEHLQFLQAKLTTDIYEAKMKMDRFVRDFPEGPYSAEANYSLGQLAELTGDYTEAQTFYMRVYEYFPTSEFRDEAALQAAKIMLLSGEAESASTYLESYLAGQPPQPWRSRARELYADALFDAGHFEEAQKAYKLIISDAPSPHDASPESFLKIAGIYEALGNYEASLRAYGQFLNIFPDAPQKTAVQRKMTALASRLKVTPSIDHRPHIIEAGLFKSKNEAQVLVARLKALGYQAYTVARVIDGAEFVSVRLGPYDSKEAALAAADILNEQAGLDVTILPHIGRF